MVQVNYSTKVCGQLAHEFLTAKAELAKQQVLIDGFRKIIFEKKKEVIESFLERRVFRYMGKKMIALGIDCYDCEEEIMVYVGFAEVPDVRYELTRKEEALLKEYKEAFEDCQYCFNQPISRKLLGISNTLASLKHGIKLTKTEVWMIPYEDATDDSFFKCSGLTIELYEGPNAKQKMIEDLTYKRIEEPLYF